LIKRTLILWLTTLCLIVSINVQTASAQGTQPSDVPSNHWAYQAVTDLANKGFVQGFPDGTFLGNRTLTRFEFANVIDRMVQTIDTIRSKSSETPVVTPTGTPVTQADLAKLQVLVDTFRTELTTIHSNIDDLGNELNSLRVELTDTKKAAAHALQSADAAEQTADNSFGNKTSRKFSITGYVQSRFVSASNNNRSVFSQGVNNGTNAGGIAAAYTGTYAEGGVNQSEEVRRARIYIEAAPTRNTAYQIQFDASGPITSYSAANQQVTMIQAFGSYKLGDASAKYPAISAGLVGNPFGYAVGLYPPSAITPERPLAFQLTNNVGLWDSQDTDKGLSIGYGPKQVKLTYALLSGSGRQSEEIQNHFDSVVHLEYTSPTKIFNFGTSYYDGDTARGRNTGDGDATITSGLTYPEPKKQLFGIDGQANYKGFFADYEFERGTYEKRSYFDSNLETPFYNPLGFQVDNYVKGNQVQGSYIWGGYTFHPAAHPLTFAFDYDTFQRSISSQANANNALQSNIPSTMTGYTYKYFPSGSTWDDVNAGYGAMYNLDTSTRLRLWYERPFAVAHAPGTVAPPCIGLYTAELQFKF
jgi:hypothetical protein